MIQPKFPVTHNRSQPCVLGDEKASQCRGIACQAGIKVSGLRSLVVLVTGQLWGSGRRCLHSVNTYYGLAVFL